jgi:hypothetical protein
MLKKNLVLGSVASLALVAASAAFAQSPPQYPDYSLPWEVTQTQQLNAEQASEPGIIASNVTPDTTAIVASTDNSADVLAYNQALEAQQDKVSQYNSDLSDFNAKQGAYQDSWSDYQRKLSDYNAKMAALQSSATVIASAPVVTGETIGAPVVRERIIHRPVTEQETFTRDVVHNETVTRPVVTQETITRPVTRWETVTRDVVHNETVTRPVVTQQTFTRPVTRDQIVREQVIDRPIIRSEVVGTRETVIAENTPVTDEWVRIYPHHERLVVFSTMPGATTMHGAQVMDASGRIVGTFDHMTNEGGSAVITLNNMKTIAVSNDNLRYDPSANMVVANLSFRQLDSMPALG